MNRTSLLLILILVAAPVSAARAQDPSVVTETHSFSFGTKPPPNGDAFNYPPDPNPTLEQERYCLPRDLTLIKVNDVKPLKSNAKTEIAVDPDLQANCLQVTVTMPPAVSVCVDVPRLSGLIVEQTKTCQVVPTRVSFAVTYQAQKEGEAQKFSKSPAVATNETPNSQGPCCVVEKGDWRASKVVGLNVYNDKNESIGSINDLLLDEQGAIRAVVISVGGFLGMGAHLIAVDFDKLKFSTEPVAYIATSNDGSHHPATTTGSASPTPTRQNPWYPDHAVFSATKDELKAAPEFKYDR